jgi:hypothetical protein
VAEYEVTWIGCLALSVVIALSIIIIACGIAVAQWIV